MATSQSASRGQIWLIDAMVSGAMIAMIVFMMLGTSDKMTQNYRNANSEISFSNALLAASDSLVLTPGSPANWESTTIDGTGLSSFGLASSSNVISPAKAAAMQSLNATNYSTIKAALGLGAVNVSIEISNLSDSTTLYSFGVAPPGTARSAVFERVALLNNSAVLVKVTAG